jgi:hypothetical protein
VLYRRNSKNTAKSKRHNHDIQGPGVEIFCRFRCKTISPKVNITKVTIWDQVHNYTRSGEQTWMYAQIIKISKSLYDQIYFFLSFFRPPALKYFCAVLSGQSALHQRNNAFCAFFTILLPISFGILCSDARIFWQSFWRPRPPRVRVHRIPRIHGPGEETLRAVVVTVPDCHCSICREQSVTEKNLWN